MRAEIEEVLNKAGGFVLVNGFGSEWESESLGRERGHCRKTPCEEEGVFFIYLNGIGDRGLAPAVIAGCGESHCVSTYR